MRLDAFDFDLPEELIALRPAVPRDASRLLVVDAEGAIEDRAFTDLPDRLRDGDALVFNDTRVLSTQLTGERVGREGRPRISATLIERIDDRRWNGLAKPGRKLRVGDRVVFGGRLEADVEEKLEDGRIVFGFACDGERLDAAIAAIGSMPLPPYIASRRAGDERDAADYQTVYAREPGAVAAPTAGLHFTNAILEELARRGVRREFVTLHVGAGTFLPVKAGDISQHVMHAEHARLSAETAKRLNAVRGAGGRIVAAGTTALRTLEAAADEEGALHPLDRPTDIFITPGYRFRAVDGLLTNFHLPRSTLFMLVSAFCGLERMRQAYAHAVAQRYRFFSYGDASLLWRAA